MRPAGLFRSVLILTLLAIAAPAVHAQTAASTLSADTYAGRAIQRTGPAAPAANSAPVTARDTSMDAGRVCLALGSVLALIVILRAVARRLMPGAVGQKNTGAIKVVSRVTLSPRQRILLVQIGKRLVMVGDTGAQLSPLCELADPDEIASIMMQVHEEHAGALRRFESFFGKARRSFKDEDDSVESAAGDDQKKNDFDPSRDLPPDTMAGDSALVETQRELTGLSAKVRQLVTQFSAAASSPTSLPKKL